MSVTITDNDSLISRTEARRRGMLPSAPTCRRLEAAGRLRPIKLTGEKGNTYYALSEVRALAGGTAADSLAVLRVLALTTDEVDEVLALLRGVKLPPKHLGRIGDVLRAVAEVAGSTP